MFLSTETVSLNNILLISTTPGTASALNSSTQYIFLMCQALLYGGKIKPVQVRGVSILTTQYLVENERTLTHAKLT